MSNDDSFSWMEEPAVPKKQLKKLKPVKKHRATASPFSRLQIVVLAGLVLVACTVFVAIGATFFINRAAFLGQPQAAAPPVEPSPPAFSPSEAMPAAPVEPPEPAATPTSILPQAKATAEPSPTATYAVAPDFINKDKIAEITGFVESWRELSLPNKIPINFLTRRQLQDEWQAESFDADTLKAVEIQQEFYQALGLIEPEVDLAEAFFDSQTDILLGYYTPEEKAMYIIAESVMMFAEEEMTFAHEYVHALQDHHFDLSRLLTEDASADAFLAARSLPEGDARLVEDLFTSTNITADQLNYTAYRYLFQEHPTLEGVSPALGIFTYFPYTVGEYFVLYLFIEGDFTWDLVNQAYSHPPQSTEQVLHPEKYLAGEAPLNVALPNLAPVLGADWREIDHNVLGEAGFLVWLVDKTDELTASEGAAGWGGDAYSLLVNDDHQRILAEHSVWDSEPEASELVEAFTAYMDLRAGEPATIEANARFWSTDQGTTSITRSGRHVLIVIAPDPPTANTVRAQFAEF